MLSPAFEKIGPRADRSPLLDRHVIVFRGRLEGAIYADCDLVEFGQGVDGLVVAPPIWLENNSRGWRRPLLVLTGPLARCPLQTLDHCGRETLGLQHIAALPLHDSTAFREYVFLVFFRFERNFDVDPLAGLLLEEMTGRVIVCEALTYVDEYSCRWIVQPSAEGRVYIAISAVACRFAECIFRIQQIISQTNVPA